MQTIAKLRVSPETHEGIKKLAKEDHTSASALIRKAMEPYLIGIKTLSKRELNNKETSFTCYDKDLKQFKDLAKEANLSWDEALRQAITEEMKRGE